MVFKDVAPVPKPFEDFVGTISKLVPPHIAGSTDEYEFPGWDGSISRLELKPEIAAQAGLGQTVKARVIGDYESGVAIIIRSRNPFNIRRYGFYIQHTYNREGFRGLEVWQAPARKPKKGKVYWGFELLDERQAQPTSPEVSESLVMSLRQAAQ